jgi:hypothetical protein
VGKGRRPIAELAVAYLKHYRIKAHNDFWAVNEVQRRVAGSAADPEDAWSLVQALVATAPDDATLGYVAAGPLEDLVKRFGVDLIEEIEESSRRDARFRLALGMIYLSYGALPPTILDRVVSASNGQIRPLGSRGA